MRSLNQKFLIKRNILLFKYLYDKIMAGSKVRESLIKVAEDTGYSEGAVRQVYYNQMYAHSPYDVYDTESGEVTGSRTTEEIIKEANLLIAQGFELNQKKSA